MPITLTTEQEETLRKDAAEAGYESAEAYLAEKLEEAHVGPKMLAEDREYWTEQINIGLDEADRGELLTPDEVKTQLDRARQERLAKRTAA